MAELAVLVDRVVAREAGIDEVLRQARRGRASSPGLQDGRGVAQRLGALTRGRQRGRPRRPRPGRCSSPARASPGRGPRSRRGAARARDTDRPRATGTAARRARRGPRSSLRALRREEADVGNERLDVAIGGADDEDRARATVRRRRPSKAGSADRRRTVTAGEQEACERPDCHTNPIGRARLAPQRLGRPRSDSWGGDGRLSSIIGAAGGGRTLTARQRCLRDDGRGRIAGHRRDADDAPAPGFDRVPAHDRVERPVGALHEHVRLEASDDLGRRLLVEIDHGIDDPSAARSSARSCSQAAPAATAPCWRAPSGRS